MATLKLCDCERGFPAVRYRFAPHTPEGEIIVCRECDEAPVPSSVSAFMTDVQTFAALTYVGNAHHVPIIAASPVIRKGRDLLNQYLYPRYRMWEERDEAGHTIMRAAPNYRRIALPIPGTTQRVPLDLFVVPHG